MRIIDLKLTVGSPLWIYGFPTVGKTHFQRTLRFLNPVQREKLGLRTVVDATDTDDWLGVFKKGLCNAEQKKEVDDVCRTNIMLANAIPSDHPRVIVTNLWDKLAECEIKPALICIPASVEVVRQRVAARGDTNAEWITKQASQWLSHITHSPWFNTYRDLVVEVDRDSYLSDHVKINGHPFPFSFDRENCVEEKGDLNDPVL